METRSITRLIKPLDPNRLSPVWRGRVAVVASGLWAGFFSVFVNRELPYYPQGWPLLLGAAVAGLWMFWPRLGVMAAMLGFVLPVAYNLPSLFVLACVILAATLSADSFVVLSGLIFFLPRVEWLLPAIPLAAGFLKLRRGAVTAGLACLCAEVFLLLSGRDPSGGPDTAPLFDLKTSPVSSIADWTWLETQDAFAPGMWADLGRVFVDHPQFLGQVVVWSLTAMVVGSLLSARQFRFAPVRVVALGSGTLALLLGSFSLTRFVGPALMGRAAGAGSILACGGLMMALAPFWDIIVQRLAAAGRARAGGGPGAKEIPKDEWSELAGVDDIQAEIQEAVRSHFDPAERESLRRLSIQPPKGVLFFGPPGTGKTKLARLIAHEATANFYAVSGTEFTSKWYGESEANLRKIFEDARENRPAVLFFDELEAFLPRRADLSRSDAPEKGILATFLAYTDGIAELDGVFLVGATNHPELIDPAALRPGRFDKVIYVSPPNAAARRAIFQRYLKGRMLAPDVDFEKLAASTERFTGADIQAVCREAILETVLRGQQRVIPMSALADLIGGAKASVTLEMLRNYERIADQYGRRSRKPGKTEVVARAELGWDDVAGLDGVKDALREAVEMPLAHGDLFRQYGAKPSKGVLLYGPPGCGKTLLAKVIAKVAKANFVHVKGPELLRQLTGQSEARLRDLFDRARESAPCVLFFDEIDALAGTRGTESATGTQILTQLLTEMDGMEELKSVVVIGATNRPDSLDPALLRPGRFDRLLYVPPPDQQARAALFKHALEGKPLDAAVDFNRLAEITNGYSSADLTAICNQAALAAARDALATGQHQALTLRRLEEQIQRTPSSLTPAELARYEELRVRFQR